jgi:hypothetical protein
MYYLTSVGEFNQQVPPDLYVGNYNPAVAGIILILRGLIFFHVVQ